MRQHCTDGSFRLGRWRAHTEALSEDSGPAALSTQGQYFALQGFYEILQPIAGELSANCCRTKTMTRYSQSGKVVQLRRGASVRLTVVRKSHRSWAERRVSAPLPHWRLVGGEQSPSRPVELRWRTSIVSPTD